MRRAERDITDSQLREQNSRVTTPGTQSADGTMFLWRDEHGVDCACDYVYDNTSGPGVVIVPSGWSDPYGGCGNASKTLNSEPQAQPDESWRVGRFALIPDPERTYPPAHDRARGAAYAQNDSLSKPRI